MAQEETLEQKVARLEKEAEGARKEQEIAKKVIADHKAEIEKLKANPEVVDNGRTVHSEGGKKYILLFSVMVDGTEVTDEVIKKEKKFLKTLIETGSGAIRQVK